MFPIKLKHIDLFTGLGGFVLAGKRTGGIETIFACENDNYNKKLIDINMNLDNAGDINEAVISQANHPYAAICEEEDIVPSEKTGISSLCIEDFLEGVVDYPDFITGGFPCVELTCANTLGNWQGINGKNSGLVHEQLRIIEELEPKYCLFENAEKLTINGLNVILNELDKLGYVAQWGIISATAFGLPHYRHRTILVAYLKDTPLNLLNVDIFKSVHQYTTEAGEFILPLLSEDPQYIKDMATLLEPRSVKNRSKRINALGNAIVPDIAEALFNIILNAENGYIDKLTVNNTPPALRKNSVDIPKMPSCGFLKDGMIYSHNVRDTVLNPTKTTYKGLYSTILSKDGNNNFTCKSRLTRPGGLGGLVGNIMSIGADEGGLDPIFCEMFMNYEPNHTKLKNL
ncbi:MAG: site-specific DNA-cytosine methylase [Colwellia sp.]|jgi:DNA (cytosine-5)-methyltransferase 1